MLSSRPALDNALTGTHFTVVGLMFGLSVMSYFDRTIMSIAGPDIIKEFQLSETEMGLVYSAFILGYSLLMVPGGRWADRFGPRRVLTWMALGSALFTGLTAVAARPGLGTLVGIVPAFVAVRVALGFATAPIYPTCGRMNVNWIPLIHRGRAQSVVICGAGLGGAVSPILFTKMIAAFGWRWSFVAAAVATAVLGVAWLLYVRDHPQEHPRLRDRYNPSDRPESVPGETTATIRWRVLLTDRNLMLLTVGYFALSYFEYIFFYWIFYYLGEIRGLGSAESAIYTTALFLTFTFMMPVGGWLCDRFAARYGRIAGLRRVGVGGLALGAVLLYAGASTSGTTAAVALMSLAFGCAAIADVTFWTGTIDMAGKEVGSACGILNTGGNLGGLLAPTLTPLIAEYADWTWGLYFGSAMAVGAMVSWLFVAVPPFGRASRCQSSRGS